MCEVSPVWPCSGQLLSFSDLLHSLWCSCRCLWLGFAQNMALSLAIVSSRPRLRRCLLWAISVCAMWTQKSHSAYQVMRKLRIGRSWPLGPHRLWCLLSWTSLFRWRWTVLQLGLWHLCDSSMNESLNRHSSRAWSSSSLMAHVSYALRLRLPTAQSMMMSMLALADCSARAY